MKQTEYHNSVSIGVDGPKLLVRVVQVAGVQMKLTEYQNILHRGECAKREAIEPHVMYQAQFGRCICLGHRIRHRFVLFFRVE